MDKTRRGSRRRRSPQGLRTKRMPCALSPIASLDLATISNEWRNSFYFIVIIIICSLFVVSSVRQINQFQMTVENSVVRIILWIIWLLYYILLEAWPGVDGENATVKSTGYRWRQMNSHRKQMVWVQKTAAAMALHTRSFCTHATDTVLVTRNRRHTYGSIRLRAITWSTPPSPGVSTRRV